MAASQFYSVCLAQRSIRACRALLLSSHICVPRTARGFQCPSLVRTNSTLRCLKDQHSPSVVQQTRAICPLVPLVSSHIARGVRAYSAIELSSSVDKDAEVSNSGDAEVKKSLSASLEGMTDDLDLDQEISRLEQQKEGMLAKLGKKRGDKQNEAGTLSGDLENENPRTKSASPRKMQSSKEQVAEETSGQVEPSTEVSGKHAGPKKNSSTAEGSQLASISGEDESVGTETEEEFSSDEDSKIDDELDSGLAAGRVQTPHPWSEWNAFLEVLYRKGYFKDVPPAELEGEGQSCFQNATYVKRAILQFSRDRDDISRFLTKKDIRVIANIGCPSTDRKVVNASKRLRVLCEIPEAQVCQQCKLKTFCTRAFAEPAPQIDCGTIDVVRVLYSFAINSYPDAESQVAYPMGVIKSVCHLLNEVVQLSAYPRDPGLPNAQQPLSASASRPSSPVANRNLDSKNAARKPGDWICPDCDFLNFSRNRECRECGTFKANTDQNLQPGDWECPECTFVNFRRNKECRECLTTRPKSAELAGGENLEPGDWACPECSFRNFRRNRECLECKTARPENAEWTGGGRSGYARDDSRWGLNKPSARSDREWGSGKSLPSASAISGAKRTKYEEWKPNLKRHASEDDDDDLDLEKDADMVFSDEEDEAPAQSSRKIQTSKGSKAPATKHSFSDDDENTDSDFDFSDVDEAPSRPSVKNRQGKGRNFSSKRIDDDDDDDTSEAEGELSDDKEAPPRSSVTNRLGKGRNFSSGKWDADLSEAEGEDDDRKSYGGRYQGRGRGGGGVRSGYRRGGDDISEAEGELTDDDQKSYSGRDFGRGRGRGRGRGVFDGRSGGRGGYKRGGDDMSEAEGELTDDDRKSYNGRDFGRGRGRGRGGFDGRSGGRGGYRRGGDDMSEEEDDRKSYGGGDFGRGRGRGGFYGRSGGRGGYRSSSFDSGNGRGRGRGGGRGRGRARGVRGSEFGGGYRNSSFSDDDRSNGRGNGRGRSAGRFDEDSRSEGRGGGRGRARGRGRGRGRG